MSQWSFLVGQLRIEYILLFIHPTQHTTYNLWILAYLARWHHITQPTYPISSHLHKAIYPLANGSFFHYFGLLLKKPFQKKISRVPGRRLVSDLGTRTLFSTQLNLTIWMIMLIYKNLHRQKFLWICDGRRCAKL